LNSRLVALSAIALFTLWALASARAFGDPLQNAFDQRQGNYDFQLKTDPINPVEHNPTKIILRIGSIDGTDIVDLPITLRIVDSNGTVLQKSSPILLTGGHFAYDYTFQKPGRYAVYADITDYAYTGQTLTFTVPVNVGSSLDFLYLVAPACIAAVIGGLVARRIMKGRAIVRTRTGKTQP
jgi:hypothetical protein